MKLSNRTVLIIGSELIFTISLIKHLSNRNNIIVLVSHLPAVIESITKRFSDVISVNLNIYVDVERSRLVEEISRRHLSPTCVIYTDFAFKSEFIPYDDCLHSQFEIESHFITLTHLDEILLALLETEAEATIAYLLPNIPWYLRKSIGLLQIFKQTIIDYIVLIKELYPDTRFITFKHPIAYNLKQSNQPTTPKKFTMLDKVALKFIHSLENYKQIR